MGKHTNYQFPSAILNEIERPLRRKFRSETEDYGWIVWVVLGLAIVAFLHYVVEPHLPKAEAAEIKDNAYYCAHIGGYDTGEQTDAITKYCNSL